MTLQQIRILSIAARHQNVTRAAIELRMSQPAVTYQLKLLEEEFGLRLYKKLGRGIVLTRQGQRFLAETEPILRQMEIVTRKFSRGMTDKKVRSLVLGGSDGPSALFLPLLASRFREAHRRTEVTLRVAGSFEMEEMVRNGEVEFAVITNPSSLSRLVCERCREEELVLVAPQRHPSAGRPATPSSLSGMPLVIFKNGRSGGVAQVLHRMEDQGIRLNIVMRYDSVEAVKNAVKAGSVLGILYRDTLSSEIERGEVKVVQVPWLNMRVESFVTYQKEKPLSADAKDFLALLRAEQISKSPEPTVIPSFHESPPVISPYLFQGTTKGSAISRGNRDVQ
jgi:LysR family transcriptional regulator for metE and metH